MSQKSRAFSTGRNTQQGTKTTRAKYVGKRKKEDRRKLEEQTLKTSWEYRVRVSTGTAIALIVQMDVDRVTEFTTELLSLFLREGTAGDH